MLFCYVGRPLNYHVYSLIENALSPTFCDSAFLANDLPYPQNYVPAVYFRLFSNIIL